MNRLKIMVATLGIAAVAVPGIAAAAPWQSVNQRQARLDQRIDQGIRSGSLTRNEAGRLRSQFRQIAQLERRYRADGLSRRERSDLDRRFDALSARIRVNKHDRQRHR